MSVGREHRSGSMPFRSGCLRAYFGIAATLSFVTTSRPGIDRTGEMNRFAVKADLAVTWRKVAGNDLDESRLAGAVVAHQADHLAGRHAEVDAMQRANGAELLADALQLQDC